MGLESDAADALRAAVRNTRQAEGDALSPVALLREFTRIMGECGMEIRYAEKDAEPGPAAEPPPPHNMTTVERALLAECERLGQALFYQGQRLGQAERDYADERDRAQKHNQEADAAKEETRRLRNVLDKIGAAT